MTDRTRAAILTWDWRQQPNLDQLAHVIHELTGGTIAVQQADTGSDEYAIVITNRPFTPAETADVYRRWSHGMLGNDDIIDL